jgi:hypothetical protein
VVEVVESSDPPGTNKNLPLPPVTPLEEDAGGGKAKNSISEGKQYYGFFSIIRMA